MTEAIETDNTALAGDSSSDMPAAHPPQFSDAIKEPGNACTEQAALAPAVAVIATAYDLNGRDPRRVIEFEHASGRRVRRLLEESAFESANRVRKSLIKAGVSLDSARELPTDIAELQSATIGVHGVPYGWSQGCDTGTIYRYHDTVYSASGPIPVYSDGPACAAKHVGDIGKARAMLAGDVSAGTVLLVAAHLAALLVPLLRHAPLAIVVSGVPTAETVRLNSLAQSLFGTRPNAWTAHDDKNDNALVQLSAVKSRREAFARVRGFHEATATPVNRIRLGNRAQAPVILVLTDEADAAGNLASPRPPDGCIELPFSESGSGLLEDTKQPPAPVIDDHWGIAAEAYINAVLRDPVKVIQYADTNTPKFVQRYTVKVKGGKSGEGKSAALSSFALLRCALACGRHLGIVPWTKESDHDVIDAWVARWAELHRARELAFERYVINAVKKLADPSDASQYAKMTDLDVTFESVKGRQLILIEPFTFDTQIVMRFDKSRVLDVLRERRLLVTNGEGAQFQKRIGGGRARFYAIDAAILRNF